MIYFASDNIAGVHPKVLEELNNINNGFAIPYGNDRYTKETEAKLMELLNAAGVFFVFTGTGANTIALNAVVDSQSLILTSSSAHIVEDECGAPTKFTGCPINSINCSRKVTVSDMEPFLSLKGNVHKSQPKVVSISQVSEIGEAYSIKEIEELGRFCKENDLILHLDGSRIANAAVSINPENPSQALKEITKPVDILTFGGTKNGLMGAEAIVVNNPALLEKLPFSRKQGMQLASKMRYVSAQFSAYLEGQLWASLAKQANNVMKRLYEGVKEIKQLEILYSVDANMLFMKIENNIMNRLTEKFFFYPIKKEKTHTVIRLITSWQNSFEEADIFINEINSIYR